MKKVVLNLVVVLFCSALVIITPSVYAQGAGFGAGRGPGEGQGMGPKERMEQIPGLTEEQKTSIEKLRTTHLRKADLIRAQIGEKKARLHTLNIADRPDVKAIDGTIDEIAVLKANLMKEREAHRRDVKALLTDEQKVYFDSRPGRKPGRDDRFHRNGRGYNDRPDNRCPYR